ncbi:hypothetical protein ACFSKM_25915 [Ancylobacter dichloromethanicus]
MAWRAVTGAETDSVIKEAGGGYRPHRHGARRQYGRHRCAARGDLLDPPAGAADPHRLAAGGATAFFPTSRWV